jgi:hypothetical protein
MEPESLLHVKKNSNTGQYPEADEFSPNKDNESYFFKTCLSIVISIYLYVCFK